MPKTKFGRWRVLGPKRKKGTNVLLLCECKCGRRRWVHRHSLRSGASLGCHECRTWTRTKGHWPKGKPRNPDGKRWVKRIAILAGRMGLMTLAALLRRDQRTLYRWIKGERLPSPQVCRTIAALNGEP